jgi:hypothetical protein
VAGHEGGRLGWLEAPLILGADGAPRSIARKLPTFGILIHPGRKTGRIYGTPINVFRRGDAYFFFLTYGSGVQRVKNVLAAGSCSLETRGRVVRLIEPELITDPELRPAPAAVRLVELADRWCYAVSANARCFSDVTCRCTGPAPAVDQHRPHVEPDLGVAERLGT